VGGFGQGSTGPPPLRRAVLMGSGSGPGFEAGAKGAHGRVSTSWGPLSSAPFSLAGRKLATESGHDPWSDSCGGPSIVRLRRHRGRPVAHGRLARPRTLTANRVNSPPVRPFTRQVPRNCPRPVTGGGTGRTRCPRPTVAPACGSSRRLRCAQPLLRKRVERTTSEGRARCWCAGVRRLRGGKWFPGLAASAQSVRHRWPEVDGSACCIGENAGAVGEARWWSPVSPPHRERHSSCVRSWCIDR